MCNLIHTSNKGSEINGDWLSNNSNRKENECKQTDHHKTYRKNTAESKNDISKLYILILNTVHIRTVFFCIEKIFIFMSYFFNSHYIISVKQNHTGKKRHTTKQHVKESDVLFLWLYGKASTRQSWNGGNVNKFTMMVLIAYRRVQPSKSYRTGL